MQVSDSANELPLLRSRFKAGTESDYRRRVRTVATPLRFKRPPLPPGRPGFVLWMKRSMPSVYQRLQSEGLMDDDDDCLSAAHTVPPVVKGSWADRILSAAEKIIPTVYQYRTMEMQLKRAERGLPPIKTASIAPTAKVEVGDQTRKLIVWGGVGLGSLIVLKILFK